MINKIKENGWKERGERNRQYRTERDRELRKTRVHSPNNGGLREGGSSKVKEER